MKTTAKRLIAAMAGWLIAVVALAQTDIQVVSGVVRDAQTGRKLAAATVSFPDTHEATVTNADGRFTLKSQKHHSVIYISCLGYNSARITLGDSPSGELKIKLTPGAITLNEVIVSAMDAREIVLAAIDKIDNNYSHNNELMRCFYRETTQKGKRYIYVAEAVTDLYKAGYNRITGIDRVAIEKGRRLVNVRRTDTLGAKIQGGPTLPVIFDLVKRNELLLDRNELGLYHLRMDIPAVLDGRPQVVVSFTPAMTTDHVLYHGKIYIDRQTLAFTRIEMELDMSDELRATECILLHKPAGVRFKPRELSINVAYRFDGTVSRIHYIHSDVRFHCEWRKRLFASPYHVEAEMVVTDLQSTDAQPISSRASFSSRESFFDKVHDFDDPYFWGDYNIIEPTESLEHAIDRLKKK